MHSVGTYRLKKGASYQPFHILKTHKIFLDPVLESGLVKAGVIKKIEIEKIDSKNTGLAYIELTSEFFPGSISICAVARKLNLRKNYSHFVQLVPGVYTTMNEGEFESLYEPAI